MSVIAWWGIPVAATVLAIAFVAWRGRARGPQDTNEAIESRERFRRAIEGGTPGPESSRTPSAGASEPPRDGDGGDHDPTS